MPDYNDGNWWPHQPGDCLVHPKSIVNVMFRDGNVDERPYKAECWSWEELTDDTIVAFRVVTPYIEPRTPREYWIVYRGATNLGIYFSEEHANKKLKLLPSFGVEVIHVREVMDEQLQATTSCPCMGTSGVSVCHVDHVWHISSCSESTLSIHRRMK